MFGILRKCTRTRERARGAGAPARPPPGITRPRRKGPHGVNSKSTRRRKSPPNLQVAAVSLGRARPNGRTWLCEVSRSDIDAVQAPSAARTVTVARGLQRLRRHGAATGRDDDRDDV